MLTHAKQHACASSTVLRSAPPPILISLPQPGTPDCEQQAGPLLPNKRPPQGKYPCNQVHFQSLTQRNMNQQVESYNNYYRMMSGQLAMLISHRRFHLAFGLPF